MSSSASYQLVSGDRDLIAFCRTVAAVPLIALDTEFVSEDRYRADLCLIQVAAGDRLAIIDARQVHDLTPFWELIASPGHQTVLHAGREEFRFCLHAVGRRPNDVLDVQIAAALVGLEYPAAYRTLVQKLLDQSLPKAETRTDWRRRPLSRRQLEYALQDVRFLLPLRDELLRRLDQLGRRAWLADEMTLWQQQIEAAERREPWRRVSGVTSLPPRGLAIARQLWRWREREAERQNRPVRRVLRDDLLVELARRQTADLRRIAAVRGLQHRDLRKHQAAIARSIQRALALPETDLPRPAARPAMPQMNLLSQFLGTALGSICRSAKVAPALAGTAQDVRELIAYRLGLADAAPAEPPLLCRGWRAEVVGQRIDKLLRGQLAIRIADPLADDPLVFHETDGG